MPESSARYVASSFVPPNLASDFWAVAAVRSALEKHDFGALLKAYRASFDPTIRQADLANWLNLSQAQISRIEAGRTVVNDIRKLADWSAILGFSNADLWFSVTQRGVESVCEESRCPVLELKPPVAASGRSTVMPAAPSGRAMNKESEELEPGVFTAGVVESDDIEAIRETTRAFRQIDNRFGGGHVRSAVSAYLKTEIGPRMIDGRFSRGTRKRFQRASAELHQLAGWMAYDVGDQGSGRRHLRQALDIAIDAGDDALSSEMLSAMSHQAAFIRDADQTIDLALAARRSAARSGVPALHAESAALEAQGLALQRDERGCIAALQRAERAFGAVTNSNTPLWLRYFDHAYLSAKFAQALRDTGRLSDAEIFARDSLQMSDGFDRGKLFNTALLASILADSGQVEESVALTRTALRMASQVRSSRVRNYLYDVDERLSPYRADSDVRNVHEEIVRLGLLRP